MVCKGAIKKATRRCREAEKAHADAAKVMYQAEAEWARLEFLRFAEEHPELKGFKFSTELEYNDEGYSRVVNFITVPEEVNDDYEFTDLMYGWSPEALALLCGESHTAEDGICSVAQAKKRRF